MTSEEERVWTYLLANRQKGSTKEAAEVCDVPETMVIDLMRRIASPNWREPVSIRRNEMTDQTDATDTPDTLGKFHRHQQVEARADVTDHWEEAIVIGHAWGTDRYDVLTATGKQIDNTTHVRVAP